VPPANVRLGVYIISIITIISLASVLVGRNSMMTPPIELLQIWGDVWGCIKVRFAIAGKADKK